MAETHHLSRSAFERLQEEHKQLSTFGRIDIARKIETARELGDLSENGDYHAAKEEQGKMEGRVRQLEALIKNAEIVEVGDSDVVVTGSIVGIKYEGDDDTRGAHDFERLGDDLGADAVTTDDSNLVTHA